MLGVNFGDFFAFFALLQSSCIFYEEIFLGKFTRNMSRKASHRVLNFAEVCVIKLCQSSCQNFHDIEVGVIKSRKFFVNITKSCLLNRRMRPRFLTFICSPLFFRLRVLKKTLQK